MPIKPVTLPARDEVVYDLVRIASISVTQERVGSPVNVSYTVQMYRIDDNGTPDDAPASTAVGGYVSKGIAAVYADPRLSGAVGGLTEACVEHAIESGLLTVE